MFGRAPRRSMPDCYPPVPIAFEYLCSVGIIRRATLLPPRGSLDPREPRSALHGAAVWIVDRVARSRAASPLAAAHHFLVCAPHTHLWSSKRTAMMFPARGGGTGMGRTHACMHVHPSTRSCSGPQGGEAPFVGSR